MNTIDDRLFGERDPKAEQQSPIIDHSPLKGATTNSQPSACTIESRSFSCTPNPSSPTRSNLAMSSVLRMASFKSRSLPRERGILKARDQCVHSPIRVFRSPTQGEEDMLAALSNLLSQTEMTGSSKLKGPDVDKNNGDILNEKETPLLPIKLFDISLESPFRPSIEMPLTLSKLPSVKKKPTLGSSSQDSSDSVFIPATQFPSLELVSQPTTDFASLSSSSVYVPPTQYPALGSSENPADLACSQAMELFNATDTMDVLTSHRQASQILFTPELQLFNHAAVILPDSNVEANEQNEGAVEESLSGIIVQNAVDLSGTLLTLPSALKKKSTQIISNMTPLQKRVKFVNPTSESCSEESYPSYNSGRRSRQHHSSIITKETLNYKVIVPPKKRAKLELQLHRDKVQGTIASPPETRQSPLRSKARLESSSIKLKGRNNYSSPRIPIEMQPITQSNFQQDLAKKTLSKHDLGKKQCKEPTKRSMTECKNKAILYQDLKMIESNELDTHAVILSEQMLVWARWKPQYYAPAVVQARLSRTRDLWKVRFTHWQNPSRSATLSVDHLAVCDGDSLASNSPIYLVRNRKKMCLEEGAFINWVVGAAGMRVRNSVGEEEHIDLPRIAIDRVEFIKVRKRQQRRYASATLSQSSALPTDNIFKGDLLSGYSLMISMGGLSATVKRAQKSHLVSRIRNLGGTFVPDAFHVNFDCFDKEKTMLLANGYYRLAKVFFSITLSIPLVSTDWLSACESTGTFISPAAFAIDLPELRNPFSASRRTLLKDWIMAVEGSVKFRASWTPVCMAAGASVVSSFTKLPLGSNGLIRVLVEQYPSASTRLARFAKQSSVVSIITVDWIIRAILNGEAAND